MKETLASLFKPYHPLGPIVAHRNVRMRGQAFVSFRDKATAALAQKDVNEFPLYGKPIVSRGRVPGRRVCSDAACSSVECRALLLSILSARTAQQ